MGHQARMLMALREWDPLETSASGQRRHSAHSPAFSPVPPGRTTAFWQSVATSWRRGHVAFPQVGIPTGGHFHRWASPQVGILTGGRFHRWASSQVGILTGGRVLPGAGACISLEAPSTFLTTSLTDRLL